MPYLDNDGLKIYYELEGTGPDLIMIHGFAANITINWRQTNWIKTLKDQNHLVLMDCRGHGKSDKPIDSTHYGVKMEEDILKLMEHLSIEKANFFGYSMGSYLSMNLLIRNPELFKSLILGGYILPEVSVQAKALNKRSRKNIINALLAKSIDEVKDPVGYEFRRFAESTGANLKALAAVSQGFLDYKIDWLDTKGKMRKLLKEIKIPVLTVVGSNEFIPGDKTLIAQLVPNACHFQIQGKDHLTVVPDPKFHMVVKAFLNYVNHRK